MGYYIYIARPKGERVPPLEDIMTRLVRDPQLRVFDIEGVTSPEKGNRRIGFAEFLLSDGTLAVITKPPKDDSFACPWLSVRLSWGTRDFAGCLELLSQIAEDLGMLLIRGDDLVVDRASFAAEIEQANRSARMIVGLVGGADSVAPQPSVTPHNGQVMRPEREEPIGEERRKP